MNRERKEAYRHLLYCAFLEIRTGNNALNWWNPADWVYAFTDSTSSKNLADALHNLAHFSALDFEDFNEDQFWSELASYAKETHAKYKRIFESYLKGQQIIC